jgi:hypothetical protein
MSRRQRVPSRGRSTWPRRGHGGHAGAILSSTNQRAGERQTGRMAA